MFHCGAPTAPVASAWSGEVSSGEGVHREGVGKFLKYKPVLGLHGKVLVAGQLQEWLW